MKRLEIWTKGRRLDELRRELEDTRRELSHTIDEVYHRDQQIKALEQKLADVRYTVNELKRLGADQQQRLERVHGVVGW